MPDTKTSAESPAAALTGAELIRAVQAGGMVYLTPSQLKTYVQQTITLIGDVSGSGTDAITTTLANTTVIAGSYTNANVTVDAKGRLLSAANGSGVAVGATSLTGEATGTGVGTIPTTLTNSAVIAKVLTGYAAGAGTIAATDSILSAIQKNAGNDALKAPLASPTFSGTVTLPAAQVVNGVTLTTSGGTTNFLRADGTYAAAGGGSTIGSDKQVLFNDGGVTGANSNFTFDKTSGVVMLGKDLNVGALTIGKKNTLYSTVIGYGVGNATMGDELVCIGSNAGANGGGSHSVLIGGNAGINMGASQLANVCVGFHAGGSIYTGQNNVYVGAYVGESGNYSGSNNTMLGGLITGYADGVSNTICIADGAGNKGVEVDSTRQVNVFGPIKLKSYTVSTLPSASTAGGGATAYVTDATVTTYHSIAAGGGSNKVTVTSDGTNWLIG